MMSKLLFLLFCLLFQITLSQRLMGSLYRKSVPQGNTWKTIYVKQKLDHFALEHASQVRNFSQRLLVNLDHWKPGGVLFFYTGNEGDIELFAQNTGFMFDVAPAFDAAVVFAEHRYYGMSLPFGNDSFSDWTKSRFLTVEQAMADFADNLIWLKESYLNTSDTASDAAVITFGGSYGGMLAAWMRGKYPSLVQGAISASAPVWMFPGMQKDLTLPLRIITRVFRSYSPDCPAKVSKSWDMITQLGKTAAGRAQLHSLFHTCKPLDTVRVGKLSDWLNEMYFDMAMVNYPYPTSFLAELPAWPVKEFCRRANATEDVVSAIAAGSQVYSNYTGKTKCLDLDSDPSGGLGMKAWNFQACMELILPVASDSSVDMFPSYEVDLKWLITYCEHQWNTTVRPYWLKHYFGGVDGYDFSGYSNIFFSNGYLDPWAAGGVDVIDEKFCLSDCPNVLIEDGAHHLDLRSSNPADPESVLSARKQEVDAIKRWTTRGSQAYKTIEL